MCGLDDLRIQRPRMRDLLEQGVYDRPVFVPLGDSERASPHDRHPYNEKGRVALSKYDYLARSSDTRFHDPAEIQPAPKSRLQDPKCPFDVLPRCFLPHCKVCELVPRGCNLSSVRSSTIADISHRQGNILENNC